MQDLDENTVTDAALAQMANTPNPRMREVMEAAVRHLHAWAREVNLTPAEWIDGIKFLTEVGHACTPVRQEFILLSDVLGLSALVNALHDKTAAEPSTETSLLGPFFRENAPEYALGATVIKRINAPEILLYGQVKDAAGRPVPGATVNVWQTDENGAYDLQIANGAEADMRGRFRCDGEGRYHFRTIRPLGYSIPMDGPVGRLVRKQKRHGFRPSHIHMLVGAPGYRELVTALYMADDPNIDSDTVFGVSNALVVSLNSGDQDAPVAGMPSLRYDFPWGRAAHTAPGRGGADPAQVAAAAE